MFRKRQKQHLSSMPTSRIDYPAGTFVSTEKGVFYIKRDTRVLVPSDDILASWRVDVVPSSEAAVKHLPVFGKLGFRNGSLVQDFTDGKTYLISGNEKLLLLSPAAVRKYTRTAIMVVSHSDIMLHKDGRSLE